MTSINFVLVRSVIEGQDFAASLAAIVLVAIMCYIGGRVHQYYKQGTERESAFRDGYNQATRSLFSLATRATAGVAAKPPLEAKVVKPPTLRGTAAVGQPRHRAEGKSTLQQTKQFTAWDLKKSA